MHFSYYGRLQGSSPKTSIGTYLVDEAYKRILDKHTQSLSEAQGRLVRSLKEFVRVELASFSKQLKGLEDRLGEIYKEVDKKAKPKL